LTLSVAVVTLGILRLRVIQCPTSKGDNFAS
jgi:hypothetical protein